MPYINKKYYFTNEFECYEKKRLSYIIQKPSRLWHFSPPVFIWNPGVWGLVCSNSRRPYCWAGRDSQKQIALTSDTQPLVTFASASIKRDLLTCRIHLFIELKTQIRIVDSTPWQITLLILHRTNMRFTNSLFVKVGFHSHVWLSHH